jgi:hypothetical protein
VSAEARRLAVRLHSVFRLLCCVLHDSILLRLIP